MTCQCGCSTDTRGVKLALWQAADPPPAEATGATSPAQPPVRTAGCSCEHPTKADLRGELERFEAELRTAGLRESTIRAYLLGSSIFARWLAGEYTPGPRRAER